MGTPIYADRQQMIDRALSRIENELELAKTEREAFIQFLDWIEDIDPEGREKIDSIGNDRLISSPLTETHSNGLSEIQTAYRETVMAVPHYEREYGDTLVESLATEFGKTVAGQLVGGESLTPALYDALLAASHKARDDRDNFACLLRREHHSMQTIATELADVESRVDTLSRQISTASDSEQLACIDDSLANLERQCTDLANCRQELIHGRSVAAFSGVDEQSLVQYLYADLETATPALSDITSCIDMIRCQRIRCLR